jgi:hypothetical protein
LMKFLGNCDNFVCDEIKLFFRVSGFRIELQVTFEISKPVFSNTIYFNIMLWKHLPKIKFTQALMVILKNTANDTWSLGVIYQKIPKFIQIKKLILFFHR